MVQHLYQTTLDRINQLSDEDRIPDSRKAEIYNLFLTLQELGDKKVELTRAIKQTFGKHPITYSLLLRPITYYTPSVFTLIF